MLWRTFTQTLEPFCAFSFEIGARVIQTDERRNKTHNAVYQDGRVLQNTLRYLDPWVRCCNSVRAVLVAESC